MLWSTVLIQEIRRSDRVLIHVIHLVLGATSVEIECIFYLFTYMGMASIVGEDTEKDSFPLPTITRIQ